MKEFMLMYKGGNPDWAKNSTPQEIEAQLAQWGAWMGKIGEAGKLVSGGSPLNYEGKRVNAKGSVTDIASSEFKELVSGYSIVKAESYAEAMEMAKGCPSLLGGGNAVVEVREVMDMS